MSDSKPASLGEIVKAAEESGLFDYVMPTVASDATRDEMKSTEAFKDDTGKPRMDLLFMGFTRTLEGLSEICTMGANKYDDNPKDGPVYAQNWKLNGMRWGRIYAATMRHLFAWMRGHDIDKESSKHHLLHAIWGLAVLHESAYRFPHLDDRDLRSRRHVRVGLDIDETILDMVPTLEDAIGRTIHHYAMPDGTWDELEKLFAQQFDWPAIEPGSDLPFEPVVYVTARRSSEKEQTLQWIKDHNFPPAPVIFDCKTEDKIAACKEHRVDIFVDDKFETMRALNEQGVFCLLYDRRHNRKHDVGIKRIKSLKEVQNFM